jgi:O-antigen/teichoic acid export membrane protein
VFSFSTIFGLLSDMGIAKIAVRDMSRDASSSRGVLGTTIAARLVLATLGFLLAQVVLLAMGTRMDLRAAAAVVSLLYVNEAIMSMTAVFQVRLAMQYAALNTVINQSVQTILIFWLISQQASMLQLVAVPLLAGGLEVGLTFLIVRRRFKARLGLDLRRLPSLVAEAWPIGLGALLGAAFLKVDSIILGIMTTPGDVGMYGAAYKPIEYLFLASAVIIQPMFPLLARWQAVDTRRFQAMHRRGAQVLMAIALPIPVVLFFVAEPLLLRILSFMLVLMVVTLWQDFTLIAGGKQRVTLIYDFAGLALHVVVAVVLIGQIGYIGAAFAATVTSLFVTTCATVSAARLVSARLDFRSFYGVVVANLGLAGAFWLLLAIGVPWLSGMVLAGLCYAGFLLLFRVTSLAELRLLLPSAPLREQPAMEMG